METHTRFQFGEDGKVSRIVGNRQFHMEVGEAYGLKGSQHAIRLLASNVPTSEHNHRPMALVRYSSRECRPQDELTRINLTKPGLYKVGTAYAYRVILPSEEPDPIMRAVRLVGIPVSKVFKGITSAPKDAPVPEGRQPYPNPAVHAVMGARVDGDVIEIGQTGVMIETYERSTREGTGTFVSRLVVGPRANPNSVRRSLELLGLSHSPEWAVGDPSQLVPELEAA